MTPKLLMVLLEVRVMSSNVNIWLDTVFQLQLSIFFLNLEVSLEIPVI